MARKNVIVKKTYTRHASSSNLQLVYAHCLAHMENVDIQTQYLMLFDLKLLFLLSEKSFLEEFSIITLF